MSANSDATRAFRENVLRSLRTKRLTITELAEGTGSSRPGISRLLNGHEDVTLARAEKIASFLGATLAELLTFQRANDKQGQRLAVAGKK